MKRRRISVNILFISVFIFSVASLHAQNFLSSVNLSLLDHVGPVSQLDARGTTRIGLFDSLIQAGEMEGTHILDCQAGITANARPDPGEAQSVNYTLGLFLRFDPFLKSLVSYPSSWNFLKSLEHGPFFNYDLRDHQSYGGYQFGLAFKLMPLGSSDVK